MDKVCALCNTNFTTAHNLRVLERDGVAVKSPTYWRVSDSTYQKLLAAVIQASQQPGKSVVVV